MMDSRQSNSRPGPKPKAVRWIEDENGCWIWQLATSKRGYGLERGGWAHRRAYERANGPIPEGWDIHHLCHRTRCVNPAHLRAVPPEGHRGAPPRVSEEDIGRIRRLALAGYRLVDIGEAFGVSYQFVSKVKLGHRRTTVRSENV